MLRRSLLLVIALWAIVVPTAFAQEPVELSEDDAHCPPVSRDAHDDVTGGCEVRAVGNDIQTFAPTVSGEVLLSTCDMSAVINIDEDGNGYGSGVVITGPPPCSSITNEYEFIEGAPREMAWSVNVMETGPGTEIVRLGLEFVFSPGVGHVPGDLYVTPVNDFTAVEVDSGPIGSTGYEVTGYWDLLKDGSDEPTDIVVTH